MQKAKMKSWGQQLQETVMTYRAGKRLELLKLRSLEEAPHGAGPLGPEEKALLRCCCGLWAQRRDPKGWWLTSVKRAWQLAMWVSLKKRYDVSDSACLCVRTTAKWIQNGKKTHV